MTMESLTIRFHTMILFQNTKFGGLSYREINNKGNDYLDQFGGKNFVIEDNQILLGEQFPLNFTKAKRMILVILYRIYRNGLNIQTT